MVKQWRGNITINGMPASVKVQYQPGSPDKLGSWQGSGTTDISNYDSLDTREHETEIGRLFISRINPKDKVYFDFKGTGDLKI